MGTYIKLDLNEMIIERDLKVCISDYMSTSA